MKELNKMIGAAIAGAGLLMAPFQQSDACSRVLYKGSDSLYIVGRSLDWKTPIPTNLYVYPRGIEKVSSDHENHISWKSKYGAIYAVGYDGGITEGMNEKGLAINGLFCKGTVYIGETTPTDAPNMSLAMFVAWMLDQCATTDEVVALLQNTAFQIAGATFDGGTVSTLHWGVTDATGKSVIFEFDHGKLKINEMGDYLAMTNDPQWESMRAIIDYWNKIGGDHALPGTMSSPDRCVRANYFAHHVEAFPTMEQGLTVTRSILCTVSVPYSYNVEGEPNLSSTQWRSYSDLRDKVYGFELVTQQGYYYIDLKKCKLEEGSPIMKLTTPEMDGICGDATSKLKKDDGFTPMW